MDRPRLFLSAVSQEFRTARNAVAATVRTLGYDPVSQDDFPTGHGELRQWLREQIDSCQGLIQIVGQGYGAEPPEVDPEFGRVSYTQFEFLYARRQGRKTWLIIAGEQCQRDRSPADLDLPEDPARTSGAMPTSSWACDAHGHEDVATPPYQAERRQLQQEYVARLHRENHLWHAVDNHTELQNVVLRLRDELHELRERSERRHRRLTVAIVAILLTLLLLGGGMWWGFYCQHREVVQVGEELQKVQKAIEVDTGKIHAHLLEAEAQTHKRELAEAEKAKDWKDRKRLRDAAEAAHKARLERIEELAASFGEMEARGEATGVFQEMTRVLAEQGVDEAIAYVESQRSDILKSVDARASATHQANRAQLQPLLKAAALYEAKGQSVAARALYKEILAAEPDWPEAIHACFGFLVNQGDAACIRTTLADARRDYEEAQRLAQRLAAADPGNTLWQRDLAVSYERLGYVAAVEGRLADAARTYADCLAIVKNLAARDPSSTVWQRDLAASLQRLGDVALAQGTLDNAARAFADGLAIVTKLAARDPSSLEWQRGLAVFYQRRGDVALRQGKLEDAARAYGEAMAISKRLATSDPANPDWQRRLAVCCERLGEVALAQRKPEDAARAYGDGLAIRKKLVASDPSNTEWQHDLSVSYSKLGDVALAQGKLDDASKDYGQQLAIVNKLSASDPTNAEWQRDVWVAYWRLADIAQRQYQPDQARAYWKQALDVLSGMEQRGLHISPDDRKLLAELRKKLDIGNGKGNP